MPCLTACAAIRRSSSAREPLRTASQSGFKSSLGPGARTSSSPWLERSSRASEVGKRLIFERQFLVANAFRSQSVQLQAYVLLAVFHCNPKSMSVPSVRSPWPVVPWQTPRLSIGSRPATARPRPPAFSRLRRRSEPRRYRSKGAPEYGHCTPFEGLGSSPLLNKMIPASVTYARERPDAPSQKS